MPEVYQSRAMHWRVAHRAEAVAGIARELLGCERLDGVSRRSRAR
jgi:hypothetical protein